MTHALYAGSFDLLTNGHVWVATEAARVFEHVTVAVMVNPDKRPMFGVAERVEMLEEALKGVANIDVTSSEFVFQVDLARSLGAKFLVRGIRDAVDAEFERKMRHLNEDIAQQPAPVTWFIMPPRELAEISSSMVKGMIGPQRWEAVVQQYVPPDVYVELLRRFGPQT